MNWKIFIKKTESAFLEETKNENIVDFAFLYMGFPDEAGNKCGWMSQEYMDAIENSWDNIEHIMEALSDDYIVFITADHGGYDRTHGTDVKEDMTIPLIVTGKEFYPNTVIQNANIKDIAPTITKILGVMPDEEWEGKCLF